MSTLELGLDGLSHSDLFSTSGLAEIDRRFLDELHTIAPELFTELMAYREHRSTLAPAETSELLIACARHLDGFVARLFRIEDETEILRSSILEHNPVFVFKKMFVMRRARRRLLKKEEFESFAELDTWLDKQIGPGEDRERTVADYGVKLLEDTAANETAIESMTRWCIRALTTDEGKAAVKGWVSFAMPQGRDYSSLVSTIRVEEQPYLCVEGPEATRRLRDGFALTDRRMGMRQVQAEVDYCIYCHDHDGDFCSKGFPEKKGEPDKGLKKNPLGVTLTGCPLDEKISEMHILRRDGVGIGALAMIMLDNPMCPATGHRICNDCMKACIYQKQAPVNIPEIETRSLTDVLGLPWGVEIYDLLTRWNPLRKTQYVEKPYNGLKVLIAGMGPAGFTLAHHLLMEGFAVVGIDGLKIEPLPAKLVGIPVRSYDDLVDALDERIMSGFGGVAEYGITVRWDKNFLKLIYLTLMRREHFQVFGGIRFGGTLTLEKAWELGFDHVSIAVGAGLPQALPIPGSLAPGMRMAADFLMALQLTGAAKTASLANLQVRLPAVVIGGGLTGVDAATEMQAYYIVQVEKILHRYEAMAVAFGEDAIRKDLDPASIETLDEYLEHGRVVRAERERAQAAGEAPNLEALIRQWGGVTIAYRRGMADSPAYRGNHEELTKALEEGIYYGEGLSPEAAQLDQYGQVKNLVCQIMEKDEDGKWSLTDNEVTLPAKTILVATGAKPNIAYFFEHRSMEVHNMQYQPYRYVDGQLVKAERVEHCKQPEFGAFTSYDKGDHRVTFIGDTHPDFNGNVVTAVASGYRIYPQIVESFGMRTTHHGEKHEYERFNTKLRDQLQARVLENRRLTRDIIELVIRAPLAAKQYKPAQVFRLQNFEATSTLVEGTRLQTETIPLTGSRIDKSAGTISVIVRERGASSRLCATLKAGDSVVLMGPSGNVTPIPSGQTVMVIGDWLAIAALRALGPAYRGGGNRVLAVLNVPTADDVFCKEELERCCDSIVWVTDAGEPVGGIRAQDVAASGDLTGVLARYGAGELTNGLPVIPLEEVSELHITADSALLKRIQRARKNELAPFLTKQPKATASVYSSMQCMLKGVCSQCLQWQVDPETGERTKAVFACSWHDEPADMVDIDALNERLGQNRLQERLSNLWLSYLFDRHPVERV